MIVGVESDDMLELMSRCRAGLDGGGEVVGAEAGLDGSRC